MNNNKNSKLPNYISGQNINGPKFMQNTVYNYKASDRNYDGSFNLDPQVDKSKKVDNNLLLNTIL